MRRMLGAAALLLVTGCASTVDRPSSPAVSVVARGETEPVGTSNQDAADDPAIWLDPSDPARSLIVATDKKAGLYVYGLDGKVRSFEPAGLLNNVDLIDSPENGIIVAASDRNDPANAFVRVYRLDPASARLIALGRVAAGVGEGYGLCLAKIGASIEVFSVLQQGGIQQIRLVFDRDRVTARTVRRLAVATQPEGCVVDPRTGHLYVGEEAVGVWRFDARESASTTGTLVASADRLQLVPDVEGLALAPLGTDGGYLIASSQGDSAFAVYRLPDMAPVGRFRIAAGTFGATEETDGIALVLGNFGPTYPTGLFVAQDGINRPAAQNFKLVSWADITAALNLAD